MVGVIGFVDIELFLGLDEKLKWKPYVGVTEHVEFAVNLVVI